MATYNDLNSSFLENNNNSFIDAIDMEAIKRSLLRLLTTAVGEDPFNRNYGSTVRNLLFTHNLDIMQTQMWLYMDITTWEPRVEITPSGISVEKLDNGNTFRITCTFRVPALNYQSGTISTTLTKE